MKKNKLKIITLSILTLLFLFVIILTSVTLSSCAGQPGELESGVIVNQIFPNIWVILAQVISGSILFLVILFLIWKPTNQMLEKRRNLISSEIADAQKMKADAEIELTNAKDKAKHIIEQSYSVSRSLIETAQQQAKQESQQLISATNEMLSREKNKVKNETQQEIIDTVFKATEALLRKEISKAENEKLVKDFIKGLIQNE